MIDIKLVRENLKEVKTALSKRNVDIDLENLLKLDDERKTLQTQIEELRAKQNELAKKKEKNDEAVNIKKMIKDLQPKLDKAEKDFKAVIFKIPNIPTKDTPAGKDEKENVVLKQVGEKTKFNFHPKEHFDIGENLDIIDLNKAGDITGSRFGFLKGKLALLEFALIQFAYSVLTSKEKLMEIAESAKFDVSTKPFLPIIPPVFIKPDVFWKMARLEPKEERYYIQSDGLYLIGSAEHTLGPIHMDETLKEEELPIRYAGFSTAFRREAGFYGKDVKGILRVHQFDKLEIESFTSSENSIKEQDFIVAIQEYLIKSLKIPYQVVKICTGDMGDPDARQIDIECWLPGQNKYRETHTADLMTDYQARRLNTKIIKKDGSKEFAHMNDATVFAIGRTLIAIMENYQQEDGSIKIPEVLQKYFGFEEIKNERNIK